MHLCKVKLKLSFELCTLVYWGFCIGSDDLYSYVVDSSEVDKVAEYE
jgi:hypothetical protein